MKVRMIVVQEENDKDYKFHDLFIDKDLIQGFFIPVDSDETEEDTVSIIYPGMQIITVEAERGLQEFLIDKFVDISDVDS